MAKIVERCRMQPLVYKAAYLCLIGLLIWGSIGCVPIKTADNNFENVPVIKSVSVDSHIAFENSPTMSRIRARGYIIAGVQFDTPPFGYINEDGELAGFEIDLLREFARRWLDDDTAVSFTRVTSADRINRLLMGDIDLIVATLTYTQQRDEVLDFSQVYYIDGQNILINQNLFVMQESDAKNIATLDKTRIAAVKGTTSIYIIQQFAQSNGIAITIDEFEQYDQAIQPVLEGKVDGLTGERGILIGLAQQYPNLRILLEQNFSEEPYAIGLLPGDLAFTDLVNQTLQHMKQDGTYDQIYRKWFPGQIPFSISTD